jgi:hypothetical protein
LVFVLTFFTGTFLETGRLLISRCLNHFNNLPPFPGAVIGGLAYRYSSPQLCLLLTAIFKLFAALSILVVPGPVHLMSAQ